MGKSAFLPLPHGTRGNVQDRGKLGLCQAEPLAVGFELFGEAHRILQPISFPVTKPDTYSTSPSSVVTS